VDSKIKVTPYYAFILLVVGVRQEQKQLRIDDKFQQIVT